MRAYNKLHIDGPWFKDEDGRTLILHYPDGYEVEVSDGTYTADLAAQVLVYRQGEALTVHHLQLRPAEGRPRIGRRGRK